MSRNEWYKDRWMRAATGAGWELSWSDGHFLEFTMPGRSMRVARSDAGLDSNITFRIVADKARTNRLLNAVGVATPATETFDVREPQKLFSAITARGRDAVVKPSVGTGGGAGITVGPVGRRAVADAIREAALFGGSIAVDERVDGRVVRVLVLDGVVLDSVHRDAAHIVGDGESRVVQLVEQENSRRSALGDQSTGFIMLGSDHRSAIRRAGRTQQSVLRSGERIAVAGVTNSGSELESTRISISPPAIEVARLAAHALGVRLAGVDLVIDDEGQPLAVLEVNTAPGLHWHELVTGEPFDAFAAIVSAAASR